MLQQYKDAIENSNIVSKTDTEGIITFVNEEFCKSCGYTEEELVGKNHNIVRHPDVPTSTFKNLWDTIKAKKTYKSMVKNLTKTGQTIYLNTTVTPILNKDGDIEEFIAIRYDVTKEVELKKELEEKYNELDFLNSTLEFRVQEQTKQLKKLNQTLEKRVKDEVLKNEQNQKVLFWQSRMASLGQMLANIAHQWRQPLSELSLALFNIKKSAHQKDIKRLDNYYNDSKIVIKSMSQTIEDFTNFFNPNKPKENFLLKDSVLDALSIMDKTLEKERISIRTIYNDYSALGILNELSQVIINLIKNSIDAFNKNKISSRMIKIKIDKTTINEHAYATIAIGDNAGGIPEELEEKIFEPYFTTKHQSAGTGLGLFMSKMIIEQSLSGTIDLENEKNGSTFIIAIPMGDDNE
mgnify:CR=1 FL=1